MVEDIELGLSTVEDLVRGSRETPHHGRSHNPESASSGPSPEQHTHATNIAEPYNITTSKDSDEAAIRKVLLEHFKEDIFQLRIQDDQTSPLRHILNILFRYQPAQKLNNDDHQHTMILSIAALNRMRMRELQIKLTDCIMRMHYYKNIPADWEALLAQYVAATRDNDYIRTCVYRGLHDPFLIRSERAVDAKILEAQLRSIPEELCESSLFVLDANGKKRINLAPPLERGPTSIGGTRTEMTRKQLRAAFMWRIVVSLVGWAFLICPMWLMTKLNSQDASLIITTLFVFAAGIAVARVLENPVSVVTATAAYAAVLVVFVGVNNPSK
ncbi:hypothetical protein F5Y04DRAFT_252902 [Hypomontagnella monticulosa]|nr:hypothetical protein F5Y04DRAFT_252902 [Hypomontagnella monticulosa]